MKRIIVLLVLSLLVLTACSNNNSENNDKLKIAVSIVPQETFIKKIAGELVDVVVMIPPGSSPANYQPSPKEMTAFEILGDQYSFPES